MRFPLSYEACRGRGSKNGRGTHTSLNTRHWEKVYAMPETQLHGSTYFTWPRKCLMNSIVKNTSDPEVRWLVSWKMFHASNRSDTSWSRSSGSSPAGERLCKICIVQIRPRKLVLDHAKKIFRVQLGNMSYRSYKYKIGNVSALKGKI